MATASVNFGCRAAGKTAQFERHRIGRQQNRLCANLSDPRTCSRTGSSNSISSTAAVFENLRATAFPRRAPRPLTSLPGSIVPPGTCLTARSVPESVQEIGESGKPPLRPISQTPEARDRNPLPTPSNWLRSRPAHLPVPEGHRQRSPPERNAAGVPAGTRADRAGFKQGDGLLWGSMRRNHAAAERPVNPPPTTAKSTSRGMGLRVGRKSIVHGGLPQPGFEVESGI